MLMGGTGRILVFHSSWTAREKIFQGFEGKKGAVNILFSASSPRDSEKSREAIIYTLWHFKTQEWNSATYYS